MSHVNVTIDGAVVSVKRSKHGSGEIKLDGVDSSLRTDRGGGTLTLDNSASGTGNEENEVFAQIRDSAGTYASMYFDRDAARAVVAFIASKFGWTYVSSYDEVVRRIEVS